VRDNPGARIALVERSYRGPFGQAPRHLPYRRAAMSFMRWQLRRGVLEPAHSHRPGSPWWRAVNERLLRDGCEAVALSGGLAGPASSRTARHWMSFADHPTAPAWYRAHNSSVVAAYLDHRDLAEAENTGIFLQLSRVLPDEYPLTGEVGNYLSNELGFGRLLDYGVIVPRLQRLYEWSAHELGAPGLLDCTRDGALTYAWLFEERGVWRPRRSFVLRMAHRALPPERGPAVTAGGATDS
jgi:hypothetical protein